MRDRPAKSLSPLNRALQADQDTGPWSQSAGENSVSTEVLLPAKHYSAQNYLKSKALGDGGVGLAVRLA